MIVDCILKKGVRKTEDKLLRDKNKPVEESK